VCQKKKRRKERTRKCGLDGNEKDPSCFIYHDGSNPWSQAPLPSIRIGRGCKGVGPDVQRCDLRSIVGIFEFMMPANTGLQKSAEQSAAPPA
jgi:hypothetical protein